MQGKRFELSKGLTHQPLKLAHLTALPPLQKLSSWFSQDKVSSNFLRHAPGPLVKLCPKKTGTKVPIKLPENELRKEPRQEE
jgi:hypothetical protein